MPGPQFPFAEEEEEEAEEAPDDDGDDKGDLEAYLVMVEKCCEV